MSWVADDEIKGLLISKAKSDEVTICVPHETGLTKDLAAEGARIHTYSQTDHVPQSRFTVVNFGRGDARVAVGHRHGDLHVIEEFSANDHPAFYMALDLIQLVTKNQVTTVSR